MDNKKTILIIIIAVILAFLTASIVSKNSNKPIKLEENVKEASQQELPVINEEKKVEAPNIEESANTTRSDNKIVTPQKNTTPIQNEMTKKEEPNITPLQVKLEVGKIEETKVLEDVYKEGNSTVVVTREFKFKSPAKYSFK